MSDRTQGSVRTESPSGDGAAPNGTAPGTTPPVTATQSIPTTGSQRAQAPTTAETPAAAKAAGATAASAPNVVAPAGQPASGTTAGAPSVPPVAPATSGSPAAAAETAPAPDTGTPVGARAPRGRGHTRPSGRGPRRARLQLRHIDTWSALKISLVLSIALFFIWMVAVGVLYGVLNALGVFDTLNDLFGQIGSASGAENSGDVVTPGLVFGGAAVIGAINIVLMTALCTVGTFIYNLCSDLVGGLELTLSERD
jgi:hypothetical protein